MAAYAIINAGVVVNLIEADATYATAHGLTLAPAGVGVGHTFDGEVFGAPSPIVPKSVTMRQARLALLGAGLLGAVETAITQAGAAAGIEWEYAQSVDRDYGLVPTMAAALGLTDAQLDALFVVAAAL